MAQAGSLIKEIDNTYEIKRFKILSKLIKSNKEYMAKINKLNNSNNNEEIISLRKELFNIPEIKEYMSLESDIRLFAKKVSNELSSIVKKHTC